MNYIAKALHHNARDAHRPLALLGITTLKPTFRYFAGAVQTASLLVF